jgi:hypothetical protein
LIHQRAAVFAQADEHHLHQAGFDITDEAGMASPGRRPSRGRLGVLIEVNRSLLGVADDDVSSRLGSQPQLGRDP